ncbi:MAG: hypothetical protein HZC40_19850 [Chloroflexi bacterium]|nr:hypothetical protein [Chloroflexota bacterium]
MLQHQLNLRRSLGLAIFALTLAGTLLVFDANSLAAQSATNGARVLQSDLNRIVLEFQFGEYTARTQRVDAGTFTALAIPGLVNGGETGKPQLPREGTLVAIPPGAQASLRIIADDARTDALATPPLPVPTQRVDYTKPDGVPRFDGHTYRADAATYSANRFYPAESARISNTGDWRSQHYIVVEFNPLQYNGATRQIIFHRRIRVEITLTYPRGQSPQTLGGAVDEGAFEPVFQRAFANYSTARNWRTRGLPSRPPRAPRYSGGEWYKIALNDDGIYKVTCADLQAQGLDPAALNPATLQLYKQNTELAINVIGSTWNTTCGANNYFEFWGVRASTKYTTTNVYWLTHSAATGKRMASDDGVGASTIPGVFTDTQHFEQNLAYLSTAPWQEADHWTWASVYNYTTSAITLPFQINSNRLASGAPYSAALTINLAGFVDTTKFSIPIYRAPLYVNNYYIGEATWNHQLYSTPTFTFDQAFLLAGANDLRVEGIGTGVFSRIDVNYFDVAYNATHTAITDTLRFRQAITGTFNYQIGNFSAVTIKAFDITDPLNVARYPNVITAAIGPTFTLAFSDTLTTAREYIALTQSQIKSPIQITKDVFANLSATSNGADYIAIAPSAFLTGAQPLMNLRAGQGLRVKLVDVQDVYDEFSDGVADAIALRDFLAYAYANWQAPAPTYAVLIGDGTFDPRNYCSTQKPCPAIPDPIISQPIQIPTLLNVVDPWLAETASDNRFVAFNAPTNTVPFLALGRLPVNTTSELSAVVNKILANEQTPPTGGWRGALTFLTDNAFTETGVPDSAGNFWNYSDSVASNPQLVPFTFNTQRIYYNPCTNWIAYPWCGLSYSPPYTNVTAVRDAFFTAFNSGRLIINYVGHGSQTAWGGESFFRGNGDILDPYNNGDLTLLTNGNKAPMMIELTCYTGVFQHIDPWRYGLAEKNVRLVGNGALASWAATGLGVAQGHDYLHRGFYDALMTQNIRRIGLATVVGKQQRYASGTHLDLLDTFVLLGDPASQLQFQTQMFFPAILR